MKVSLRKLLPVMLAASLMAACGGATGKQQPAPGKKAETTKAAAAYNADGSKYIPATQRTGSKSVVYFTRDLSAKGLQKIYEKVNQDITGKVAIKVHTGEKNGPNIIDREGYPRRHYRGDQYPLPWRPLYHGRPPGNPESERLDFRARRYSGRRRHGDAAGERRQVL